MTDDAPMGGANPRLLTLRRLLNLQVVAEDPRLEDAVAELMGRNGLTRAQIFQMLRVEAEQLMDAEERVVEVGPTAGSPLLELAAKRLLVRARMGTMLGG